MNIFNAKIIEVNDNKNNKYVLKVTYNSNNPNKLRIDTFDSVYEVSNLNYLKRF